MTLLVRDEEDILRANIDFHLSQGVDFIIATDNLSVDGTADILKEYEAKGKLHYIYEPSDDYSQYAWVTRMARMAYTKYGAKWVINNDADEFWWPREGNLKTTLAKTPETINVIVVHRKDFVFLTEIDESKPFYEQMIYKDFFSKDIRGDFLPPKVAHRGSDKVNVAQGNHTVMGIPNQQVVDNNVIEILHFPLRSYKQFINKIQKGGAAYARNAELPPEMGFTWRVLYQHLQKQGSLTPFLQSQAYTPQRIVEGLDSGRIVEDTRLRDYLNPIYQR
ncbi:MAG: glycosyltransferase family 2 protein [Bacteroidota bacterium]